jgi:uncharacterized protein YbaP (TraB family)
MTRFLRCLLPAAFVAAFALPARADSATHPAFWVVHGKSSGTAYILSSVHALPPGIDWHRPDVDAAIRASDAFIFEVPNGTAEENDATRFIVDRGLLPRGQTLRSLLAPAAQKDYDQACTLAGLAAECLSDERPWLAAVVLTVSYMNQRNVIEANAPDEELLRRAVKYGKEIRYFDTGREQLEILAQFDTTMGINGFSNMLGDFSKQPAREDALVDAWRRGDTGALASMVDAAFAADPSGREAVDAHSRMWADRLESLLSEGRTYFVTVGVAHLIGPKGVPALLRADGYPVDGP